MDESKVPEKPKARGKRITSDPGTRQLTDPRAMRALAHPLRLRLLGELRMRGPQSVGMLSDLVDEAPGSISYHIGRLAQFGFVEEAPELARDKRERWWRSAHATTSWDPLQALADPEHHAAGAELRRTIMHRYVAGYEAYLAVEPALPPEWVRGTTSSDAVVHLTSDELVELQVDLEGLVERWQARSDPDRSQAKPVTVILQAFRRAE
jgi:DNA-binding transcriptional ArsR family regulator